MALLEYSLTRPIILSRLATASVIAACVLWIVLVTFITVATSGYQYTTVSSNDYNSTMRNWYEKIWDRNSLIAPSWNCSSSIIKVNES
jgi:hypothetical protein